MAWTSKVSNIIKTAAVNSIGNRIANSFTSTAQTSKVAAKLLNKSPLEIGSTGPLTHMDATNNPYQYGTVYYPQETTNLGEGHYVIFDVVMHQSSKFKSQTFQNGKIIETNDKLVSEKIVPGSSYVDEYTMNYVESPSTVVRTNKTSSSRIEKLKTKPGYEKKLQGVKSGIMSKVDATHNYISDSIVLYTPADSLKFNYGATYSQSETGLAGLLGQKIGEIANADDLLGALKSASEGLASTFTELAKAGAFGAASLIPGFENARDVYDKSLGQAVNPNLEVVFKSVPFRKFTFPFRFAPKDQKEKDNVHKIIQLFKFHMLPEHKQGLMYSGYFNVPSEFQITYMYREDRNSYIPRVSRCVLESCNIDYAPEGVVSTFKADDRGAPPTIIDMELSFTETEIMTKETVAEGF